MTRPSPAPLPVSILGTGVYDPGRVVTSAELDERHQRPPGTTYARSGVVSRRWVGPRDTSSSMAAGATAAALGAAGLDARDLDALIVSAVAPEQPMPTTAVLTLATLDADGGTCEAFDVNASCVGFLTALSTAAAGIVTGRWRRVAVVASEVASPALDSDEVECSALFGDGAAAAILAPAPASAERGAELDTPSSGPVGILATRSAVWPEAALTCRIDGGGTRINPLTSLPTDLTPYRFRMEGVALLRHVARHLPAFLDGLLDAAGVRLEEVDVVIPHQASGVGLRYLRERFDVRPDAVVDILADHGNQVSASLPTALHHAVATGRLRRGDLALLLGTGAGLTLSATVLRY